MASNRSASGKRSRPIESDDEESSNPFDSAEEQDQTLTSEVRSTQRRAEQQDAGGKGSQTEKTIPKKLLTRMLHEFFEKDSTRISRTANEAVAKYVDVFVREAIARTAVEKKGGFLEVRQSECRKRMTVLIVPSCTG